MSLSNVYSKGWVPHTCIAMASTVRIFSQNARSNNFRQIGLIQSFKPTDTRKTERARGVGYGDRVAEIVPGMTDVSITTTRMALYNENILESFGYYSNWNTGGNNGSVRTLAHMKNPFDINEVIVFHDFARSGFGNLSVSETNDITFSQVANTTVTWYHDCWINNWARTIDITGNLIIMEDVTIDVTWVDDGISPNPYQQTDIWSIHGLGCQNRGEFAFDPGSTAAGPRPEGSMSMNSGTSTPTPAAPTSCTDAMSTSSFAGATIGF